MIYKFLLIIDIIDMIDMIDIIFAYSNKNDDNSRELFCNILSNNQMDNILSIVIYYNLS